MIVQLTNSLMTLLIFEPSAGDRIDVLNVFDYDKLYEIQMQNVL